MARSALNKAIFMFEESEGCGIAVVLGPYYPGYLIRSGHLSRTVTVVTSQFGRVCNSA